MYQFLRIVRIAFLAGSFGCLLDLMGVENLLEEVKGKPLHHLNHQLPTVTNLRPPPSSTAAPPLSCRIITISSTLHPPGVGINSAMDDMNLIQQTQIHHLVVREIGEEIDLDIPMDILCKIFLLSMTLCSQFFDVYEKLLTSPNYVTRRQSLKLLSEFLLESPNSQIMKRHLKSSLLESHDDIVEGATSYIGCIGKDKFVEEMKKKCTLDGVKESLILSAEMGEELAGQLLKIQQQYPNYVKEVQGRGLFIGVEFNSKNLFPVSGYELCKKLKYKGVLAKPTHDTFICFTPPLHNENKKQCLYIKLSLYYVKVLPLENY
ncbi:Ornithine aminotransferase, mitochondrial [Glycine soja]